MTEQPDDPYASPPGWQPPPAQSPGPPAQPYGPPAQPYGPPAQSPGPPAQPYGAPAQPYGAPAQSPGPPAQPYGAPPPPYGPPPQQYAAPYGAAPYGAPYGQHAPGYAPSGYPVPSTTNGYAIAALACSIVLAVFVGIGSILGIVFGIIGLRQCRAHNERGRGLAIAGIVIGAIGILFWLLALIGLLADSSSNSSGNTNIGAHGAAHSAFR